MPCTANGSSRYSKYYIWICIVDFLLEKECLGFVHVCPSFFFFFFILYEFQSHYEDSMIVVMESVLYGFGTLGLIFIVCECAQLLTNAFSDINATVSRFDWYLYPIEIQKLLVQITMYAQKPVVIAFFGSIECSREQFRKVNPIFHVFPPFHHCKMKSYWQTFSNNLLFHLCYRWQMLDYNIF